MTQEEQAIVVLRQVAELAQSKGILTLKEATIVDQAITILFPEQPVEQEQPIGDTNPQVKEPRKSKK